MSEQTVLPSPETSPEPNATPPGPTLLERLPVLCAVGFVVLAAAIIYVWQSPTVPAQTTANTQALQTVQQRLADLDARISKLEQRPVPDIGKVTAQADAVDRKLDVLGQKVAEQAPLAGRLDTLSTKVESLAARDLAAVTAKVTALESNSGNVQAVNTRLTRLTRLQEATFALSFGRPIGDLPGAPGPLARYSRVAPPTQAQLQLRFHDAEQAALAAPPPDETSPSFAERAWDRAQSLVTIRRGNDVVVGNPVAITLHKAQTALDAGDLGDAVAAVETLTGPPAQAMAGWLDDAKGLLEARAALDKLAGQA
jgi:hypothetical protein